ncbi:transposase [Bradyrhizobium sp. LA2.1]
MEGSATDVRQLEYGVQALSRLGEGRRFQADFRCRIRRSGYGVRHGRRDNRQSSPSRAGSKRGTQNQAIGKSKGGWTTKILALTDALGNLVRFILLPGHRFDTVGVAPLIKDIEFGGLIADKAFDSNWIIEDLNERRAKIVISQHQRRAQPLDIDKDIYKWRHLIENFFGKLKEFKRIAMRCDKTDGSFEAMIYLATAVIHSR